MDKTKRQTQIIISMIFTLSLSVTILIEVIDMLLYGKTQGVYVYFIGMVLFFIVSLISFVPYRWAQALQTIEMLIMSYTCFILNGDEDFYSWGFLLVFTMLSWYYDFVYVHTLMKLVAFAISFLAVIFISGLHNEDVNIFISCLIYFFCVFSFIAIIFRDTLKDMLSNKEKVNSLESLLQLREKEIEEMRNIQLNEISSYSTDARELQSRLAIMEAENRELKKTIKEEVMQYITKRMEILNDQTALENELKKHLHTEGLKDIDYKILMKLLYSKGGLSNAEIAFDINCSEQTVKNRLHNIMPRFNVRTRAELVNELRLKLIEN